MSTARQASKDCKWMLGSTGEVLRVDTVTAGSPARVYGCISGGPNWAGARAVGRLRGVNRWLELKDMRFWDPVLCSRLDKMVI